MMNKTFLAILITLIFVNSNFCQDLQDGQKRWSAQNRLTIDDFKIKIADESSEPVYSQFVITHSASGLDFLKKNLNQRIQNIFLGNASWIDTMRVQSFKKQIDFQQLQFDLAEIEARMFRKRLLQEKGKIAKGFDIVNQINNSIMTEFSKTRLQLMKETEGGTNEQKVAEWKDKIAKRLNELNEFRFGNKKKIRLKE